MEFINNLTTFQQMSLFAGSVMLASIAATIAAVVVAKRQNAHYDKTHHHG